MMTLILLGLLDGAAPVGYFDNLGGAPVNIKRRRRSGR